MRVTASSEPGSPDAPNEDAFFVSPDGDTVAILDGVTGDERVVIVWCEAPHALAPLLARLRDGGPVEPPDGCAARELVLTKAVRR